MFMSVLRSDTPKRHLDQLLKLYRRSQRSQRFTEWRDSVRDRVPMHRAVSPGFPALGQHLSQCVALVEMPELAGVVHEAVAFHQRRDLATILLLLRGDEGRDHWRSLAHVRVWAATPYLRTVIAAEDGNVHGRAEQMRAVARKNRDETLRA